MTTNTAASIIKSAFLDAGKLARGASLSIDQLADGMSKLNDLVNFWQTQGLKLWLESEQTVTLVEDQQRYSIYPSGDVAVARPLRVKQVVYRSSSDAVRPVRIISREEWTRQPSRSDSGIITQAYPEKLYDRINLYVWMIPNAEEAAGTLRVVLHSQTAGATYTGDSMAFPPEWALALRWGLADQLTVGMPEPIVQRCMMEAERHRSALEAWDVEEAPMYYTLAPEATQGSGFA